MTSAPARYLVGSFNGVIEWAIADYDPTASRWFFWKPQWFYSWPIKVVRSYDEFCNPVVGLVTWSGSVFYRYGRTLRSQTCDACVAELEQR